MTTFRGTVIATERTLLTPISRAEAEELLKLFRDPSVRRYLLDDELVSRAWVLDEIEGSDARFAESGVGLWSIRVADRDELVGFVGLREFFDPPELQILYGLFPGVWGRGLATEAASAIRDHVFGDLGHAELRAATDLPNEASARVLLRLGMRLVRTTGDKSAGTAFYAMTREAWESGCGAGG